ncbi:ABC1 kinase family protein [Pseudogracilibacillus auburnensis]|uniref:ABC1 kinase family protein n=1 Tax=Pseudogracilibacillus auburnensis TaxID=1494959 RepID=UPI001A958F0F|nr:AarF/ABC1/UbiB kinase family protein [Pseudogracilibacillus auburnensis]MBO1004011.1 AarF/ABC1/UbiB kinase family protein [Pseudogracilibacillus auburnensis]
MFRRRIRHIQRYRDIALTLSRYGFGYIAMELGLTDLLSIPKRFFVKYPASRKKTTGERIRLFLEELGPTFIKLGQFASTRTDILPPDIILELEKLQDDVPPFSSQEAKEIIEQETGQTIEEIFTEFHEEPLAAASIGQVHFGVLKTGEYTAIKVRRPNISKVIETDLEILNNLAELAEQRLKWASRYQIKNVFEEFSQSLTQELDYRNEGKNAIKFAKQFEKDPHIRIPKIYEEYSTKRVLMMEYIEGTKLNDVEQLDHNGYDRYVLAERIVQAMFHQIFIGGFFHGDPHPGNILALPGEEVLFLDFGLVGRMTPDMKKHLSALVIALIQQNTDGIIKAITKMGIVPHDVNIRKLRADVDSLREKYYDVPLSEISLGEAVHDLFSVTYHHHIHLPADFALLGKTLLTMEGVVERLNPEISIIHIAEPFGRQLIKERFHPKNLAEHFIHDLAEYGEIITDLPDTIHELKSVIRSGKVRLEMNIPALDYSLKKLDRISNRLSFSIVLLAFSIIMTGLIVGSALVRQSTLLWNIPVIEIGFVIATLMFLLMLYGIFKSGRF